MFILFVLGRTQFQLRTCTHVTSSNRMPQHMTAQHSTAQHSTARRGACSLTRIAFRPSTAENTRVTKGSSALRPWVPAPPKGASLVAGASKYPVLACAHAHSSHMHKCGTVCDCANVDTIDGEWCWKTMPDGVQCNQFVMAKCCSPQSKHC